MILLFAPSLHSERRLQLHGPRLPHHFRLRELLQLFLVLAEQNLIILSRDSQKLELLFGFLFMFVEMIVIPDFRFEFFFQEVSLSLKAMRLTC